MEHEKTFEESSEKVTCEEWKPIKEYENLYLISNYGNVKSQDRVVYQLHKDGGQAKHIYKGKKMKLQVRPNGYIYVGLHKNGKTKCFLVHRLVASHFIEKPKGKNYINHIDCNIANNFVGNLEWCTQSENIQYAYDNGRKEGPNKRKIMQCDMNNNVIKIWESEAQIERELHIFQSNIYKVCSGKRKKAGGYIWKYAE